MVLELTPVCPFARQVRTQTLVQNAIIQVDANPFKQFYAQHYGKEVGSASCSVFTSPLLEHLQRIIGHKDLCKCRRSTISPHVAPVRSGHAIRICHRGNGQLSVKRRSEN